MSKKRALVSVTNDLYTDQRVHKVCMFLHENGFEVKLIGRHRKNSPEMDHRPYQWRRLNVLFDKGPLFYAFYNIFLFFYLLIQKKDVLVSNDLDTLLPNYLVSKICRKKLVYDSHELFTEVPELVSRPNVQRVWLKIEEAIFPKLKNVITVNESIAQIYKEKYHVDVKVVRNIASKRNVIPLKTKKDLGIPENKFIVLLQGAWINMDRGGEELLDAFKLLNDKFFLVIAGGGDVIELLKKRTQEYQLMDKVKFFPKMPYDELCQITVHADLGVSLDKNTNMNYQFSLPNKLFDYIHSGVLVLVSDLVEIKRIVQQYQVGEIIEEVSPEKIAEAIQKIASDSIQYQKMKLNTQRASEELNWENETKVLEEIYL
ncbi:MAG: glycosyltransferase [Crocinitomicaceae bacterium]